MRAYSRLTARVACVSACEQASHGGELAAAVASGAVRRSDVTELGSLLVREKEGRRSATDITLFDSTGLAIQDLAIAKGRLREGRRAQAPTARALVHQEAGGLEEVELRVVLAEECPRHESAACKAEDVAVARVAAGDP